MFYGLLVLIIMMILFVINFYRSKNHISDRRVDLILSPAHGTVADIIEKPEYCHIIIFLSPTDIHRQYMPIDGYIENQVYDRTGQFHLAYKLGKSRYNEKMITSIWSPLLKTPIYVTQVAGLLTRRIESYVEPGTVVEQANPLGIIKLGSRVDILIPYPNINGVKLFPNIKIGTKVHGPSTQLFYFDN